MPIEQVRFVPFADLTGFNCDEGYSCLDLRRADVSCPTFRRKPLALALRARPRTVAQMLHWTWTPSDHSMDAIPSISREGLFLGLFAQGVQCVPSRCLSVKAGRRCPWKNIGSALGIQIEIYAQINVVRIGSRERAKDGWYERGRKRVVAATHNS